jgi:hypothetical protein
MPTWVKTSARPIGDETSKGENHHARRVRMGSDVFWCWEGQALGSLMGLSWENDGGRTTEWILVG